MKCPSCRKHEAVKHAEYGYVHCTKCQDKKETMPGAFIEFTSDSIREQRREWKKDIIQPFRDNVLSKEYIQEYGTQGLQVTDDQVKQARYTYKDTKGWWQRDKSKGGKK